MKWDDQECSISNGVWKGDLRDGDSAASAGTALLTGRPRNTAKFFCASKRPDRLQGPLILLLSCYLGFVFWVKPIYLHMSPSLEWVELCFHTLPPFLHGVHRRSFWRSLNGLFDVPILTWPVGDWRRCNAVQIRTGYFLDKRLERYRCRHAIVGYETALACWSHVSLLRLTSKHVACGIHRIF